MPEITLPMNLERLSPDEIRWLAAKSGQSGKPVDEVVRDLISRAAAAAGFKGARKPAA